MTNLVNHVISILIRILSSIDNVGYNPNMKKLIAIEKLIREAKRGGVDFGKGDPYNRLRYYTKIGWIPHMIRKKNERGKIEGHYPAWVLKRLERIERLKTDGYTNEEISKKLQTRNFVKTFSGYFSTPDAKTKLIIYSSFFVIILIFMSEVGLIGTSKEKQQLVIQGLTGMPTQILDSGTSFVPSGNKIVFVKNTKVTTYSKVYITFNDNYSPATRYWVPKKIHFEGFYVELDSPVYQNTEFTWWVSN